MRLLPEELRHRIPPLYATEQETDPMVWVKFFTPWTNWTWYVTEYDGDNTFFGWVEGQDNEFGYFSLSELESIKGPWRGRGRHSPPRHDLPAARRVYGQNTIEDTCHHQVSFVADRPTEEVVAAALDLFTAPA
jgi:hypothetical protein